MSAEPAPATRSYPTIARLEALVGHELGISVWRTVTQDEIDRFAEVTDDPQYIHVDPVRAAASPFGGTIAHGFLTLSLLPLLNQMTDMPRVGGIKMGVNYGSNRLRFLAPVRAGKRVRGHFKLLEFEEKRPGQCQQTSEVTVEIEGEDKPALICEWIGQFFV